MDVSDLILAVRPEAMRAGLPGAADCMIVIVISGVRQPEERLVAGPLLLDMDLPHVRFCHKQSLAEQLFHQNLPNLRQEPAA